MAKRKNKSIQAIALQWGLIATVGMILFFLLMSALGLAERTELRVFNLLIQGAAITIAILSYKKSHEGHIRYLQGIGLGALVGLVNAVTFALFMVLFLSAIDPDFMQYIKENEVMGSYMTPVLSGVALLMEGSFSAFFVTFTLMQYFKTAHLARKRSDVGRVSGEKRVGLKKKKVRLSH